MGSLLGPCLYVVAIFVLGLGPIVLVFAALFAMAVLYVVALMTPGGSPLTATPGGRVLWAGAILILGVIGWIAGASALGKLGLSTTDPLWWSLLSAVPFALAAALCAGGWTSLVSLVLTTALILTGCS
ncbi:hypothetical protein [Streptosporangium roseum]|uniref:Uncharacterized protein n=1 Tax=Streptosporangium roseum (strain ATCC 12428 / DSM 43021 / JCM 3005 / KCTC 9067 / NCIMB 10171 / NRRL 2505 / NI 9100) TaxID=479432 RepID=D2B7A6_STRRD|nr:hypothetical protein [Streptosporangium roseum]ACZ89631.1 hypothetical protein Sros_6930 [Streptosporangium roseum DSM 43021]